MPEPTCELLNERQLLDYEAHRKQLLKWALSLGKNPEKAEGYSHHTVEIRAYRLDKFYRWVWQQRGYTTVMTHDDADTYLRNLATQDGSTDHKANTQKAMKMLFKWRQFERDEEPWEPAITFSNESGTTNPRDFLTREERGKIREAALEYGSIPHYNSVSPCERDRWKGYLAQRYGKRKDEIALSDWKRANGWKYPSLVWASLDAGLRPIEVGRATTAWVDAGNEVLRIPKDESSKNRENWIVGLQSRTADVLERWIEQRDAIGIYDNTDALWLTREGNPYQSATLRHVMNRLCEIADISMENRSLTWYAIRHSVGTYMTREEGLAAAQAQLRHKSEQTTMKYDQTPVEDRRSALERMG